MKISFIIQARMGSSRLPNKVLLPFYNDKCILELLIEKISKIPNSEIIVATSDNPKDEIIADFCNKRHINYFQGSENDVLQRYIDAAEAFGSNKIIRVCSDNPFLELKSIQQLVNKATKSSADYISFKVNMKPSIKTHFGFWTEYVTLEALRKIKSLTSENIFHEHVTNFIYTHPELFSIEWIDGTCCLQGREDIRLTCDTIEDFNNSQAIYQDLCKNNPFPTIYQIVNYLDTHEMYLIKMIEQINSNSK